MGSHCSSPWNVTIKSQRDLDVRCTADVRRRPQDWAPSAARNWQSLYSTDCKNLDDLSHFSASERGISCDAILLRASAGDS